LDFSSERRSEPSASDLIEGVVVQREWMLGHRFLREHDQTDAIVLPVAQEIPDRALPRVQAIAAQVALLHRLGQIQHDHDVDALDLDGLFLVSLRARERHRDQGERGDAQHPRQR